MKVKNLDQTNKENGFTKKLGAAMILESLNRDMFPLWDAHNEASKKVAEFLGYELGWTLWSFLN